MADIRIITPDFSAAPQIQPEDAATLAADGYVLVICNRPDGEEAGQPSAESIAREVHAQGLQFAYIPVAGGPSQEQVAGMGAELAQAGGKVLAYCRSGTRSATTWALAMATQGQDPDSLITAAAAGGYDLSGMGPLLRQLAASRG